MSKAGIIVGLTPLSLALWRKGRAHCRTDPAVAGSQSDRAVPL